MLVSPLRYPGGKAKLFDFFAGLIQKNGLLGCRYCEPYAGGAGLALKLLSAGLVESVALNDVDEAIWAFWTSVLEHNKELCRLIECAVLNIDEWHRQREVWRTKDVSDPISLGFATFYLNRTNRSGIIEGAGPVGGYAQLGAWRLDARFDPSKQASSIRALLPFRSKISITQADALDFIGQYLTDDRSLTYLDPPYYIKGSKLYRNSYTHSDHINIRDFISRYRDARWVLSYDATNEIFQIYSDFDKILYSLNYSAGRNAAGREVVYLSDALAFPDVEGFLRTAA